MPDPHILGRATAPDIAAVARLHRAVRQACLAFLPELHTPEEDRRFYETRVFPACEVWLAGADPIAGFVAFREGWVDHLYVRPERHRQGIGSALLRKAMDTHPRLKLWAFQKNERAMRFYLAHGFREIDRTDGSANEELEPDALLEWIRPA